MRVWPFVPGALMLLLVGSHLLDIGVLSGGTPSMSECYDPLSPLTGLLLFGGTIWVLVAGLRKGVKLRALVVIVGLALLIGPYVLAKRIYGASVQRFEDISREALGSLAPKMTGDRARAIVLEANRRMTGDPSAKLDHSSGLCAFEDYGEPVVATGTSTVHFSRTHYRLDGPMKYALTLEFDDGLLERAIYETYVNAEVGEVGRRTIYQMPTE